MVSELKQIGFKVYPEDKKLILEAVKIKRLNLAIFLRSLAVSEARRIIKEE